MIVGEVITLKKTTLAVMAAGLILTILISNMSSIARDGCRLDKLRGRVLRLHILANSDSEEDQRLKLLVRDELLKRNYFSEASDLTEAEAIARERLDDITAAAEQVLRENGSADRVTAELETMDFTDRIYGDITMPAGEYRALRIKIGRAEGHNWWCVMYPPLCIPAACGSGDEEKTEDTAGGETAGEEYFDDGEIDILKKPKKYKIRFAIWDKIKEIIDS